jgi:hypothetical protein
MAKKPKIESNFKPQVDLPQSKVAPADIKTGYYSAEKGGYYDEKSGQLYPTSNPNFVPGAVKMGADKSMSGIQYKTEEDRKKFEAYDTLLARQQELQQNKAMAVEATQPPQVTQEDVSKAVPQETILENVQTGGAAVGGLISGGLAGAGTGAAIGSVVPGIGTAIGAGVGAVAGAIVGAVGGAYTSITLDKRGDVKQARKVASIANTNFGQTIDALNAGIISKDEALKRWKRDKISLYAARENLKRDTDTKLDRFLSGGVDELADTNGFVDDLNEIYENEFALALMQPNPQNIKYSYNRETEE